jgi:hypothetical protein
MWVDVRRNEEPFASETLSGVMARSGARGEFLAEGAVGLQSLGEHAPQDRQVGVVQELADLQRNVNCRRRDSNPRHADYESEEESW